MCPHYRKVSEIKGRTLREVFNDCRANYAIKRAREFGKSVKWFGYDDLGHDCAHDNVDYDEMYVH